MRTAFLSDLHLGTRTRGDLLSRPEIRRRLMQDLRCCDQVVLLGDAIELRDRPLRAALASAAPFLRELGETVAGGRVVLVPGNHDHRLALEALDLARHRHRRESQVLVEVRPGAGGPLAEIRRLLGTDLTVAYPAWRPADGVWATHGHYLDVHSAAPTLECVAAMVVSLARRRPRAEAWAAEDYEAVLAPTYDLFFRIAQRQRVQRLADAGKLLVRAVETRLGVRGSGRVASGLTPPAAHARSSLRLGVGGRLGVAPGEQRRPGLLPFTRVLDNLRVEADHVLFGHTHRTGPTSADPATRWRTPGGTALWNTGSWVYEPAYVADQGTASPYWPGTLVTLEGSGPPRVHRLLDRLQPVLDRFA